VGCERFFSKSSYISSPKRANLDVRTYKRLALLSTILQHVYVCPKRIAEEYLRRCSAKAWKKENTIDSHKCFNLERILEAEMAGDSAPAPITLEEFEAEAAEFGV
jgi:hypothetical protein